MRPILLAVLVAAVAACSANPKQPENTLPPKATPQQCEQVADHLVGLMMKNLQRDAAVNETADAIRKTINDRCVTDGWGPDATDCFSKLQSIGAQQGKQPCEEFLSIDQRNNMDKSMNDLFEGPDAGPGSGAGSAAGSAGSAGSAQQ